MLEPVELVEPLERTERKGLLPLRLGGASCGGARRRRLARLPGSCCTTRQLMEPMELLGPFAPDTDRGTED